MKKGRCVSCQTCDIEGIATIDERGQMVLPKEVREKAGIKPGDKFALVALKDGKEVCCIALIKAEKLREHVKKVLSPLIKEISD